MRNFKLLLLLAIVSISSFVIYPYAKGRDTLIDIQSQKTLHPLVENRKNITYPINDFGVWRIANSVFTVIYPINATGQTDVWIVQSDIKNNTESTVTVNTANLGFYSTYLKLHNNSTDLLYLLYGKKHSNYLANTDGLIRIVDTNLLLDLRSMTTATKAKVVEDVIAKIHCRKDGSDTHDCKCSGGTGATSCECGGNAESASWFEQVSCGEKMFACCPGL